MNDNALHELMRREADEAPLGDGDDLRRGKARLRRHRAVAGGTGLAAVALAATVISGSVSMPGDDTVAATHSPPDRHFEQIADLTGRAITAAMIDHTRIEEFGVDGPHHGVFGGVSGADARLTRLTDVYWYEKWSENGGLGYLQVTVSRHNKAVPLPQRWYDSCAERFGPWLDSQRVSWPDSYDSCDPSTVNGQPVFAGVEQRSDRLWILVKYLRADGDVVELGFNSPYLAADQPILNPSLTTDQLIEVATDPRVRFYPQPMDGGPVVIEPTVEPTVD
jgi:hypothetical protein